MSKMVDAFSMHMRIHVHTHVLTDTHAQRGLSHVSHNFMNGLPTNSWTNSSVPRETPLLVKTIKVVTFLIQNLVVKMNIAIKTFQT